MKLSRLLREQRDSARMSAFGAHPYRTRAEHDRRFGVRTRERSVGDIDPRDPSQIWTGTQWTGRAKCD